jgi:DNA-binding FadR family transcriptional regulator
MEARLRPGQRLVERELTERIGVSRTTAREAIRELAAYGPVTTIPHKPRRYEEGLAPHTPTTRPGAERRGDARS